MLTVNLTTTYQRLHICRIALVSLLLQSRLPDQINLWVSKDAYLRDQGIADVDIINKIMETLPEEGRKLVSVRWVTNIGPYRKLIPILREAEMEDVIVTADDDIFYGVNWLSGLLTKYSESGGKPVAARVRAKKLNFLGKKTSYLYWRLLDQPKVLADDFVVTFGGGAVLTRAMFRERDIRDDSFLKVAPTADDLWYSKLMRRNNNDVIVVPSLIKELSFIQHNDGLINQNFPSVTSLLKKIRYRIWDKLAGFFGVPVSGNDLAYANIERYFRDMLE